MSYIADAPASGMDAFRSIALPTARSVLLPGHPLVGATLLERETREYYEIEQVLEGWWKGRYLLAVALHPLRGHRISLVVDRLDCLSESIAEELARFSQHFVVTPDRARTPAA